MKFILYILTIIVLFSNCNNSDPAREEAKKTIEAQVKKDQDKIPDSEENQASGNTTSTEKNLNVSYDEIMNYLSDYFEMDLPTQINGQNKYTGRFKEYITVELIGQPENITSASLMLRPLDIPREIHENFSILIVRFLMNAIPEATEEEIAEWVLGRIGEMVTSRSPIEQKSFYGKQAEITFSAKLAYLKVAVRPE
jgi:hypothetical protein